jgi:hypothetical protein
MNLCIPRIEKSITKEYIYKKLCDLNAGKIERLTEIPLKNDPTHKRILFKIQWQTSETSKKIQEQLHRKKMVNIVYELPWYWKIVITNHRI